MRLALTLHSQLEEYLGLYDHLSDYPETIATLKTAGKLSCSISFCCFTAYSIEVMVSS